MYKISTSKAIALLFANKNIKTQSKTDFLNTWDQNQTQESRTWIRNLEKAIKYLLLHLTNSKTTILHQNQTQTPFKHPSNIKNNFKSWLINENNIFIY
jgi:hypothetical protein